MKRLITTLFLGIALSGPASAGPPDTARIEHLLEVMEANKIVDQMLPILTQQTRAMIEQQLDQKKADPAQRQRVQRMMESQEAGMRKLLTWKKLKPAYVRVYADTLSAAEVDAMARFYESPEGRSVRLKMPQILQRTMVEMQPLIVSLMQEQAARMRAEIEAGAPAKGE